MQIVFVSDFKIGNDAYSMLEILLELGAISSFRICIKRDLGVTNSTSSVANFVGSIKASAVVAGKV